jgi:hypothetical protein
VERCCYVKTASTDDFTCIWLAGPPTTKSSCHLPAYSKAGVLCASVGPKTWTRKKRTRYDKAETAAKGGMAGGMQPRLVPSTHLSPR